MRLLVLLLLLPQTGMAADFSVNFGPSLGVPFYGNRAMQDAESAFLGDAVPFTVARRASPAVADVFSQAPFEFIPGLRISLSGGQDFKLGGVSLTARLRYTLDLTHARFPQGIGIFTDPASVAVIGHQIAAEVVAERGLGQNWTLGAGLGLARAHARSHVTSALLDVWATTDMTAAYLTAFIAGRVSAQSDLVLEGRLDQHRDLDLALMLGFHF